MPRLDLVHYPQETPVTCGAAVMRTVVKAFFDEDVDEATMASVLGTDDHGTRRAYLERYAESRGLIATERGHNDVRDIQELAEAGWAVVICYELPHRAEDHYAVVEDVRDDVVVLCDPKYGPKHEVPIDDFEARWCCMPGPNPRLPRWALAMKPPERPVNGPAARG